MALFNGLFKSAPFQVFHLDNKLTKAGEKFFADHPNAKKVVDSTQKAVDAYLRAMNGPNGLKSKKVDEPRNAAFTHNYNLHQQETEALCQKILSAGAKMVVTDFRAHTNLLVFTEDMVLFWTAGLFNDGVYIHPAPYKEKFLSHIYVKGVGYFYYYQSPRGTESDRVWLGEIKLTPENQLHTAPGYNFTGDRKEDHNLDIAFGQFLDQIWK